jgi:hypothetical protein
MTRPYSIQSNLRQMRPESMGDAEKRGQLIRHLEDALADGIQDGHTGYLIERALDEARARQFRPMG